MAMILGFNHIDKLADKLADKLKGAANAVHFMDARQQMHVLKFRQGRLEVLGDVAHTDTNEPHIDQAHMEFISEVEAQNAEIAGLPISRRDERQGLLVKLLVTIVNYETESGKLTEQAGNQALESMAYWNSLNTMLQAEGFKRLGNGHFSAAYSHQMLPGKVIKVGFKKEDSGAAYVAFCRMHQGHAGIPAIHDVQRHAGCYTVIMDRLDCAREAAQRNIELMVTHNLVSQAVECGNIDRWNEADLSESDKALAATGIEIYNFFHGIARFDMHWGNVMLDKERNLIITDPVSFSNDEDIKDFRIDPDELLAEIEVAAKKAVIERARQRQARKGTQWQEQRKAVNKRRRKNRKEADRISKERARREAKTKLLEPDFFHARQVMGDALDDVIIMNNWFPMCNIMNVAVAADLNEAQRALVMGRIELPMDKRLDAQFLRG